METLESLINKAKKKPEIVEKADFDIYFPKSSSTEKTDEEQEKIQAKQTFELLDEHKNSKGFNREELYQRIRGKTLQTQAQTPNIVEEEELITTKTTKIVPKIKKIKKNIDLITNNVIQVENVEEGEHDEKEMPKKVNNKIKIIKGISNLPKEEWFKLNKESMVERLHPSKEKVNIKVDNYVMNDRETFVNFINTLFKPYRKEILNDTNIITCDTIGKNTYDFSLLTHQKLVRDYLNLYSPYRGLLLYHGLGSGKTCTSIAIAEGMKSTKKVIILTPASLERNYIEELKKCGDSIYKKQQHWEWVSIKKYPEAAETLSTILNLPLEYIRKKKGAWLINYKKENNYNTLNSDEVNSLDDQLDQMIENKYTILKYNGLRKEKLKSKKLTDDFKNNLFDNAVVIIDEAHNFISRIVNKISKEKDVVYDKKGEKEKYPGSVSLILYDMLLNAHNAKIVLLTGTPIINYPNEIGILFNILRGFIKTWEIPIKTQESHTKMLEKIQEIFSKSRDLDYINYTKDKILSITRNPYGFENKFSKKDGLLGVTNHFGDDRRNNTRILSDSDFERHILNILKNNNIEVETSKIHIKLYKCLPDKLDEFMNMFINSESGDLNNSELFKRRILGLTSYFRSAQEGLLPKYNPLTDLHIIKIPMSNYQFAVYESARKTERKEEKKNKKPKVVKKGDENIYIEPSSTYRIFSRLFCNFVMPNPPGRPLPNEDSDNFSNIDDVYKNALKETKKKGTNDLTEEGGDDGEIEGDEVLNNIAGSNYQERIKNMLDYIKEHSDNILSTKGLETYSPKYLEMLQNINNSDYIGLHLVYSQFRSLEGITIFKMVLDYHGYTQFKIKKNASGQWIINISEENKGKPTYALYTGTESAEEKEMIRNIYNGDWDPSLPITSELKEIANNNNLGEIIKVLMITASGSEGINLRNTRYVHIMEPYWHPVRIEQVIGRARRICSHKDLPLSLQTVEVFIYLMTFTKEQKESDDALNLIAKDIGKTTDEPLTSDEALYEISTIKQSVSTKLTTAIKETAIDCATYVKRGGTEQLNCIQFYEPSPFAYSFIPDYKKDITEQAITVKQPKETWTGQEVEIRGENYIYREMSPNKANLYDVESYYLALENPNVEPRLVAYVNIHKDGRIDIVDV